MALQDGYLIFVAILAGFALLCVCCVIIELRTCRQLSLEEAERKRHAKYNGITSGNLREPIELIGSRPEHERPQGVDWSISMWSPAGRGKYGESDRGYVSNSGKRGW